MISELEHEKYHDYQKYVEERRDLELKQKAYEEKLKEIAQINKELEDKKQVFNKKYQPQYTRHITREEYNRLYGKKKKQNFITILLIIILGILFYKLYFAV